ncbi:MAG: hypothetical protein MHM6MM_003334 [Cercozoa sp. M6MM]
MQVSELNGIKTYCLSAGKTTPQFLEEAGGNTRALRYNDDYRRRVELIQDLDFPHLSTVVKMSPDGQFLLAAGMYKPRIKIFDVQQLSLKCERYLDNEVRQFQVLSDDFSKLAILRCDRAIEFHAKYGKHHIVRIPRFGRDLAYHYDTCQLYAGGDSNEVYRLDLEQGEFAPSLRTSLTGINKIGVNPQHGMLAFGSSDTCAVECWDPRDSTCLASLDVAKSASAKSTRLAKKLRGSEVSALRFHDDGLTMAVGTSRGHVLLYDMRSPVPMSVVDHRMGKGIHTVRFLDENKVLSADSKVVKIWDKDSTQVWTSVHPSAPMNDLCVVPGTGLMIGAAEQHRMHAHFIPALAPAPAWCSFLDSMTEEMEEQAQKHTDEASVYEDFKFVTREELEKMGLAHLIGSTMLRTYMHGFFMPLKLYREAQAVIRPDAFKEHVKQRIQDKIKARRGERITVARKVHKKATVNADYADELAQREQDARSKKHKRKAKATAEFNPMRDERFAAMFENPDFAIEHDNEDYVRLHASSAHQHQKRVRNDGGRRQQHAPEEFDSSDDEMQD